MIELMISIGIIAVLLGLLAPALKKARDEARNSACLSNQRQLVLGWILYTNDHKVFPSRFSELIYEDINEDGLTSPNELTTTPSMWWDWGGVDWRNQEDDFLLSSSRPINDYVGSEANEQGRAELFQCPSDDFLHFLQPNHPLTLQYAEPIFQSQVDASNSPYAGQTLFDTLGTSYRANDWIWTEVGDRDGWLGTSGPTISNRVDFVEEPSRFPIIGDYGTFLYTRFPQAYLASQITLQVGFWHGKHRCNLGFFDGSARSVPMGFNPVSPDYSFYLSTRLHAPTSMAYAHNLINYQVPLHGFEHLIVEDEDESED